MLIKNNLLKFYMILISVLIIVFFSACSQSDIKPKTQIGDTSKEEKINGVYLKSMNNFYIGDSADNQSLIHAYTPVDSKNTPIIMIPGLGLGANIYESTPDNRNGWAYDFLKRGYTVYTVNTSDLVSAGISESETQANFSKWDSKSIWLRWGLGPEPNKAYDNGKFPVESFEQFYSAIPMQIKEISNIKTTDTGGIENLGIKGDSSGGRKSTTISKGGESSTGSSRANQQEVENMIKLLEKTGPAILLVHSMGGEIGYEVTRRRPDLVKGIVAIEPVGSPTEEKEIKEIFSEVLYLGIYGDYLESRNQVNRFKAVERTVELINDQGGQAKVIRLTEENINGNSHLMMLDKNSSEISNMIIDWLDKVIK